MTAEKKKKRGRVLLISAILLFAAGLSLLVFPVISDWLYERDVQRQKDAFENMSGTDSRLEALYQELLRQNKKLFEEKQKNLTDPFSYSQPSIDLSGYGLDDNIIGFVSIPKMDVELPILLGANEENMRKGAVHLTETSYPIGGDNTNCVLAAHRGYSRTAMFRDIELLEKGDEIFIENFRQTITYQVEETVVISPTDVDKLLIQPGKDMVTLITCHPYRHNYQRYVVYCRRSG